MHARAARAAGALLAFAALSGGCQPDIDLTPRNKPPEETYPVIEVDPESVDFGQRTSADFDTTTITVRNTGFALLTIDAVTFEGAGSFALVMDTELPVDVDRDETFTFDVTFSPAVGGDLEAAVTITSNDPYEGEKVVPLFGNGAMPLLEVTPDPMSFGSKFVPCGVEKAFTVTNRGPEPLEITSFTIEGDPRISFVDAQPPTPTLFQGQEWTLPVKFTPTDAGTAQAELVVASNDLRGTLRVPMEGVGKYAVQGKTDTFEQPETLPVNIMFAVDQSCSMGDQQSELVRGINGFTQILENANVDWKVGVITGAASNGDVCFQNGIITAADPSWKTKFSSAVSTGGYYLTESLLEATANSMDNQVDGTCNANFRDPDAPLHLIMISDERDQSDNWGIPQYQTWYVNRFLNFGGAAPVRVHAIVDLYSRCGEDPQGPGGYLEAASATGGSTVDICSSNWASNPAFQGIAQSAINDLAAFELSTPNPDEASLEVRIDGQVQAGGWAYDPVENSISFDIPPPGGSTVDVTYNVLVNCSP